MPRFDVKIITDFGEIGGGALPIGEPAVLQDLQELVEHARMALLDLVKQDDAEGPLTYGIGQLAAGGNTDVARRRAEQPRRRMLFGKLAHVETDVRALIAEQQLCQRLRKLGFADPRRSGEEQHAARAAAERAGMGAGEAHDGAHQDIDGFRDPLDAAL